MHNIVCILAAPAYRQLIWTAPTVEAHTHTPHDIHRHTIAADSSSVAEKMLLAMMFALNHFSSCTCIQRETERGCVFRGKGTFLGVAPVLVHKDRQICECCDIKTCGGSANGQMILWCDRVSPVRAWGGWLRGIFLLTNYAYSESPPLQIPCYGVLTVTFKSISRGVLKSNPPLLTALLLLRQGNKNTLCQAQIQRYCSVNATIAYSHKYTHFYTQNFTFSFSSQ